MTTQNQITKRYHITTTDTADLSGFGGADLNTMVVSSNARVANGYLSLLEVTSDDAGHEFTEGALDAMSDVVAYRVETKTEPNYSIMVRNEQGATEGFVGTRTGCMEWLNSWGPGLTWTLADERGNMVEHGTH